MSELITGTTSFSPKSAFLPVGSSIKVSKTNTTLVSNGKSLIKSITLDLNTARDKEPYYISCSELTFNIVEGNMFLYIDEKTEDKKLTINKTMSMEANINKFFISNESQDGIIELWIWG